MNRIPSSINLPRGDPAFNLLALIPSIISKSENHCKQQPATNMTVFDIGTWGESEWQHKYVIIKTNADWPIKVIVFGDQL